MARKSIVPASQEYLYWPMVLKVASPSQILAICEANADNGELVGSAISAYLKTVYEGTFADAQKLLWYRAIMDYAQTDAQKVAILQKVGTTSAFQGIFFAAEYLDDPATQQAAAIALRRIVISNPSYYGPEITALMQRIRTISTGRDFIYDQQLIDTYLEKAHDDEGYVSLFDGETLAGWQGMVGDGNPYYRYGLSAEKLAREQSEANLRMAANWVARDGEIQYVGTGFDNLCSAKKYADFEMYVDWKIYPGQPDGDAGIYLRSSPQVQIWDTARTWVGAEVGSGGLYNNQLTESKPLMVADNPVGEWNTFYIKMVGERVTVWLNGQLVTDQIVMENYWDRSQPILPEEFIELQAHGSKIGYRNIHIHEFPTPVYAELSDEEKAEGFELLFDGRTLEKWQGNKVDYNVVAGEIAVESRSRGGSWIGDLYTVEEFADFVFRFEFKLTKGANNGVGVRAPGTGDAAYEGCEVQILDHFDDIYQPWLKDYQYHGSVYGIIPADWSEDVFRPVGEWNSEEIYMKGSYVRVTLNGKVITEGDLKEASKDGTIDGKEHPGLARTSGHIGFLGHGDNLWLRNIRVKRL
ncbi:MAG: DUF1080 domain-containing protein [Bacteroidales bacterium]|nr:DUF1080 domain-containing protein [Bacteroidales bacterium]